MTSGNYISNDTLSRIRIDATPSPSMGLDRSAQNVCINIDPRQLELKKLSDARVARWGNTLAAQRTQRLEWKEKKAEEEEKHQRALELEAARERERQREELLQKAHKIMDDQTEASRKKREQQHRIDIAQTIRTQILERERRNEAEKLIDASYHKAVLQNLKESEEYERKSNSRQKAISRQLAVDLRCQMKETRVKEEERKKQAKDEAKKMISGFFLESQVNEEAAREKHESARLNAKIEAERIQMDARERQRAKVDREEKENAQQEKEAEELIRRAAGRAALVRQRFEAEQRRKELLSQKVADDILRRQGQNQKPSF